MINRFGKKIQLAAAFLSFLSLYGFSEISLNDIETAVMKQEYLQAKRLALQLLSDGADEDLALEVRYYVGLCDLRLEQYAEARAIFTELIKGKMAGTFRDKIYLGLFDAYYLEENYVKADETARQLLRISPQSEFLSLIYLKCARAGLKLTLWDDAHAYLDKIITQFPESLEAHVAGQLLNEKQYFAVQVGAFIERQRAENLSNELQQKGEYAYIVEIIDQQNRIFYRVRVGQLALLEEAQELKSKLSRAGYPTEIYP